MIFDFVVCFEAIPHSNAELLKVHFTKNTFKTEIIGTSYLASIVTLDLYPTKKI